MSVSAPSTDSAGAVGVAIGSGRTSPPGLCGECRAVLAGPYCSGCGQRAVDLDVPARALLREAFREFIDIDRRLVRTVAVLFRRPGVLTRVYVRGARVRYTSPFRLYLIASVLFFSSYVLTQGVREAYNDARNPQSVEVAEAIERMFADGTLQPRYDASFLTRVRDLEGTLQAGQARAFVDRAAFINAYSQNLSRALLIALPVLSLILMAVFARTRWRPIRHLVFALHFGAVFLLGFLALMLTGVVVKAVLPALGISLGAIPDVNPILYVPGGLALVVYLERAMRRVYPARPVAHAVRVVLTAVLFCASLMATFLAAVLYSYLMLA